MTPRSYLFVPAERPERIAKALAASADAVIVDLEDAVSPADKDAARRTLRDALQGVAPNPRLLVRVNGADTPWFADDLAACALPAVAGVMLSKAGYADDLADLRRALPDKPIVALVETAEGFDRLREIARAAGVVRLAFGSIDFQLDLGIGGDDDALLAFRSRFVLESRLAQLAPPVDGVTTAIDDTVRIEHDALRARRLGFGAKLCIHPRQVEVVNRSFSPSAAEIDWAQRVVGEMDRAGGAVVTVDGKMVDRPVLLRAQALLQQRHM